MHIHSVQLHTITANPAPSKRHPRIATGPLPLPATAVAAPRCTCFRVRKLARLMSQRFDRALAPAGINLNQYSILRRAGAEDRTISELARELGMDRSTLSRDLQPLLAAGWAALAQGDDARQRFVRVTAACRRTVARAMPHWQRAQDALGDGIGAQALTELHARLEDAIAHLQTGEDA